MGRPNPVLTIWVAPQWRTHPAIKELVAKGHDIQVLHDGFTIATQPDAIIHPAAHGWHDALFEQTTTKGGVVRYPYLDTALMGARKRRRACK